MAHAGTGAATNHLSVPDIVVDEDESVFNDDTLPSSSQTIVNPRPESDGFDAYDLSFEFTPKELEWVDKTTRIRGQAGGANYLHQIEEGGAPEPLADGELARSPYDTFRAYQGYLTVHDIAGPSWCEFQTAYDHLAARNEKNKEKEDVQEEHPRKKRRLEKEPERGTQTTLDDFDKSERAGGSATAAFMKRLQYRPSPEPEPSTVEEIPAYSNEDDAARRLVKEILCMDRLSTYGQCNGMDIFGMINGFVVTGKPDGVTQTIDDPRELSYATPPSSRLNTPAADEVVLEHLKEEPQGVEFTDIRSIKYKPKVQPPRDEASVKLEPPSPRRLLRHIEVQLEPVDVKLESVEVKLKPEDVRLGSGDVKVALNPVKPEPASDERKKEDCVDEAQRTILTIWKRRPYPETYEPNNFTEKKTGIMLMCYYKLLVDLFSPDYSFEPIWEKLGIDGDRPLTLQFVKHADQFIRLDNTRTLNDLVDEFFRRRAQVKNLFVDSALRISYEPRKKDRRVRPDFVYQYSAEALESYLDDVLQWWRGERPAKGVPPESASRKCSKCKHSKTCWWRRTHGGTKPLPPTDDDW
ncbi:unnamed protein product [Peniophora sp. CBMAI 1063]|nr:unnamed protein product [Peniophora sp. CBMAI 1063]